MWRAMLIRLIRDLILQLIKSLMDDDANGNGIANGKEPI